MLSQQDKKLENMQRCIYAILHKKTDLKSARQNLQVLRGVFRHIHFFKASFRIKFQFVLHDTCLSLSLKKKQKPETSHQCETGNLGPRNEAFSCDASVLFLFLRALVLGCTDYLPGTPVLSGSSELLCLNLLPVEPV